MAKMYKCTVCGRKHSRLRMLWAFTARGSELVCELCHDWWMDILCQPKGIPIDTDHDPMTCQQPECTWCVPC